MNTNLPLDAAIGNSDVPEGFKMTELGLLPEGWEVLRLGEVATAFSGVWGNDPTSDHRDTPQKVQIIRVSDITDDFRIRYNLAPLRLVTRKQVSRYMLQPGDIIVVKSSGSKTKVISGRCAYFNYASGPHSFLPSNFTLALRCDEARIIGQFLWLYLLTDQAQKGTLSPLKGLVLS